MAVAATEHNALVALHRFGLGARGGASGDLKSAARDPRGFLKSELSRPGAGLLEAPGLQSSAENLKALFARREEMRLARQAQPAPPASGDSMPTQPPQQADARLLQQLFRAESLARWQRQCAAEAGFIERLVAFWSNHFCVSVAKDGLVRASAGAFEREAIRPHVLGRFADMLLAVERHPAMLQYLDNTSSFGPNSQAGRDRKRGLNENFAREILELHTLGVGGGYTQADVAALARILTGWTLAGPQARIGEVGAFVFLPQAHEPSDEKLLGRAYPSAGEEQGRRALAAIARHPATATFIATKFARHFVADVPPQGLVKRLASVFTKTDGDLKALALALIGDDDAWAPPLTKMRTPQEFLIATTRLTGRMPEDPGRFNTAAASLGQPVWQPPGPNGFPDTAAHWASAQGVKARLDVANEIARRAGDSLNAIDLLEIAFGSAASKETRQTVARAESRRQAFALLLMSPEFQRR
ncbi:MAG: DUF1800 domain-containing protein [Beijerinckiaceae bacterium]